MKANMAPFLSLLGASTVQYVIPVYQRTYAWEEDDCRTLWDDIIRAGKQDKPPLHRVGTSCARRRFYHYRHEEASPD